jgi:hypothetical protein
MPTSHSNQLHIPTASIRADPTTTANAPNPTTATNSVEQSGQSATTKKAEQERYQQQHRIQSTVSR